MIRICLAITLALTVVDPALAFDPSEHRGVSNVGLKLCSRLLASRAAKAPPGSLDVERLEQAQKTLKFLLKEPEKAGTSEEPKEDKRPDYGQIVLSVDHYAIAPNTNYKGERISDDHEFRGYELFRDRKSAQLGLQARSNWLAIALRRLGAIHSNDIHFQHGAVEGVRYFHDEATKRAAAAVDEAELRQAFILNAIADHLMQDFLAGGHAVTPRANFHDLAAAVIHDDHNKDGVLFRLRTESSGWKHLKELAQEIEALAGQEQEQELKTTSKELADFIQESERRGDEYYRFHGDGRMTCTPCQRPYMLLITARSALDVVESFLLREQVDKIESSSWFWKPALAKRAVNRPEDLKGQMDPPAGGTSSGDYDLAEIGQIYTSDDGFKINSLMLAVSTADDFRQGAVDVEFVRSSSTPVGAVVLDTKEDAFKGMEWNFAAYGGSYFFAPDLTGFDVHILVLGPLGGQDYPMNIRLGLGAYSVDGGKFHKKLNGGLGIGRGFGLAYVELRYERSYVARSGHLHGRWAPSLGMRVLLPRTWGSKAQKVLPPALRKNFKKKCPPAPQSEVAKSK